MRGNEGSGAGGNRIELAAYRLAWSGDEMINSEIRALYNYWETLRAGRPCPYRAEVGPRDVATDSRNLFVLEDLGEGNLRFRLAGSALLDAFGYELRGMSVRSIMEGRARESLVALIQETLAEPGVGYARLRAPDQVSVWEVLLLPLRGNFGRINWLIGCLHPVNVRIPAPDEAPLRFTIEEMSIRPLEDADSIGHSDAMPLPGFAEDQTGFDVPRDPGLTSIEGGLTDAEGARTAGERPKLRVVKPDE